MRDITKIELTKWKEIPLFHNCGQTNMNILGARPISLKEAIQSLGDSYGPWFSFGLMLKNRTATIVHKKNYDRAISWGLISDEIDGQCEDFTRTVIEQSGFPSGEDIVLSIKACLMDSLMEVEFSDITPSVFYEEHLRPILLAGHLPCGWDGPELDTYWAGASEDPVPEGTVLYY